MRGLAPLQVSKIPLNVLIVQIGNYHCYLNYLVICIKFFYDFFTHEIDNHVEVAVKLKSIVTCGP